MSKLQRKIWALVIASILTVGIVFAVIGLGRLTPASIRLTALQAAAEDAGTIRLDCNYSEGNHTLAVKQVTTYRNHSDRSLSAVKFYLYANAYQKNAHYPAVGKNEITRAYPHGFSEGYVKVTTPHTILGESDNTVLTVPLTKSLAPNQSVDITLEYTIKLPNVKHRLGYTENTVNLGNFYAIPVVYDNDWDIYPYSSNGDPFYNEPYNFDVTFRAPAGYIVATSGEQVGDNHYRGYLLRDFAVVLSRNFNVISREVGDTLVNYYYLNDPIPEISLYTACNALAYFSGQFIDYPYATLAVVQTDFLHGGMEYGALVYIALDVTDQLQYQTVIVHEIAHQWWYGLVGNNQNLTAWIDEGLAEYSTAAFFEDHPQYGKTLTATAEENLSAIKMFESIMDEYKVPYTRQMLLGLLGYKSTSEYTINTYARGMLLFYNISTMVGHVNLNQALGKFAAEHCFQFGTAYALGTTLEAELGHDLSNYLNNYLAGNETPML